MTNPNDPFERAEPDPNGSLTLEEVWAEVGRALTSWEHLETVIAFTFFEFMRSPHPGAITIIEPAAAAYAAVITFSGRMDMVKSAADSYFEMYGHIYSDGYAERVTGTLIKIARKAGARRNEIAHARAGEAWAFSNLKGVYLQAGSTTAKYLSYHYTASQVRAYSERFEELARCFNYLNNCLLGASRGTPLSQRPDWVPAP